MRTLLVEAQKVHEADLAQLTAKDQDVQYVICAASNDDGTVIFNANSPAGGAVVPTAATGAIAAPARRIDSLVSELGLRGPFFLKFDTHGSELAILAGARNTLDETALIMMEVYNFKLNFTGGKNLTFDERSIHLKALGFRMVDLCLPLHRPGDGVFWQAHFFFIRSNHRVFQSNSYKAPSI